ncbi:hypothetical protein [Roseomonas harenae]|uniref:hypothetical protein n=1 Tax=Muricoccus harenae TaxID=2692566 RepID=UPI0013312255|nr:hypothetical protein [Roseomonas harenae]
MRKILGVAVLATALIGGIAGPYLRGRRLHPGIHRHPNMDAGKWPHAACQQFRPVRS